MNIVKILIILAYQLAVMSFAQYPVLITKRVYKNPNYKSNHITYLIASLSISFILLFTSFANTLTLFTGFALLEQKAFEYISIIYGVTMIALVSASLYCIVGNYIIKQNMKKQRVTMTATALLIIFIALILLYSIIIANNELGVNYVELSNNYYLPVFTCIMMVPVIVNIWQKKSLENILNTSSILMLSAAIISIIDLFVIKTVSFQLIPLLYAIYALHLFKQIYYKDNKENMKEAQIISRTEFMDKYSLSQRELEVIELVCKGKTNNEIADSLILSPHTVKSHLKRIYTKLSIDSRHKLLNIISSVDLDK